MIWVISGTQDGRELAGELCRVSGEDVVVTVVSNYGKLLAAEAVDEVLVGRFTQADMENLIRVKEIRCVVDASHPYAAIVSETARAAAAACKIDYLRYERPEVELPAYEKLHHVSNEAEAAELAGRLGERIYLTTGSKTLRTFMTAPALTEKEVWARVLPTVEVLMICEELGLTPKYIVAVQGPFSYEMNLAMFVDTAADVVVMKNSGLVGGTDTKLAAAMAAGLEIIVIDRPKPQTQGFKVLHSAAEVIRAWEEL